MYHTLTIEVLLHKRKRVTPYLAVANARDQKAFRQNDWQHRIISEHCYSSHLDWLARHGRNKRDNSK